MFHKKPILIRTFALFMLLALTCTFVQPYGEAVAYAAANATTTPSPTKDTYNSKTPEKLEDKNLTAMAAVVIDSKTGKILYDKSAKAKMFPASTTKVMTLLLALEHGHLDDQVTISPEASNVPKDSSLVPVMPGDKMIFRDLLYGFMINSGNDAANAIAVIVSGSVDAFVKKMNERAKELGCEKTNFVNPHGYHNENHYTTAYDLALITREGMKIPEYRKIFGVLSYTLPKSIKYTEARTLPTRNMMMVKSSSFYYQPTTGGKTGYTSRAGQCLVSTAQKNDKELISVALHATKNGKWEDTKRLFEYGFSKYDTYSFGQLYDMSPIYATIRGAHPKDAQNGLLMLDVVPGGAVDKYKTMSLSGELDASLKNFASQMKVDYTRNLEAPIIMGDIIGTLTFAPEGAEPMTATLIASRDMRIAPESFSLIKLFPQLATVNMEMVKFIGVMIVFLAALSISLGVRGAIRRHRRQKEMLRRREEAYKRYRASR